MREILFRGKRVDNGEWAYGYLYVCGRDNAVEISNYDKDLNMERMTNVVIPETVGQYTGLTDKNGTKIFEGDILAIKFYSKYIERVSWQGKPDAIASVFYDLNAFSMKAQNGIDIRYADFCDINYKETEIIGNIHDNPELIESEVETE